MFQVALAKPSIGFRIRSGSKNSLCIGKISSLKLKKFLEPVRDSLSYFSFLVIPFCDCDSLEVIINQMTKLKTFECDEITKDISAAKLKPNESIIELKILSIYPEIRNLLRSLVNLETLRVRELNNKFALEWIATNMIKLKKIEAFWPVIKEVHDHYEQLKATQENINKSIETVKI
jgi:hypothetical protein